MVVVCNMCGTRPEGAGAETSGAETSGAAAEVGAEDRVPMSWVRSVEHGVTKLYCDRCSREHLRSIEAKLDAEYW